MDRIAHMHLVVGHLLAAGRDEDDAWNRVKGDPDPEPQKQYVGSTPPTVGGNTCRLIAYADYLLDLLAGADAEEAYAKYCQRHDACPP